VLFRSFMSKQEALLLDCRSRLVQERNIAKILSFFGVPQRTVSVTEILARHGPSSESSSKSRVIASSDSLLHLINRLEAHPSAMQFWKEQVHSVFFYRGDDFRCLQELVVTLTGDQGVAVSKVDPGRADIALVDDLNNFCGVMAGVRAALPGTDIFFLKRTKGNATNIISHEDGAIFSEIDYHGVPVFFSTSSEITDIDAELTSQNFDVRENFLSAVPIVLYIKWAFAETCWCVPETNACLIIDDPLLKRRHGFVDFQELLSLMKRHKFSTNVAFIPWNWRRSNPDVVRLFRENPENYSLSVHGCDHTRAEFGSSDQEHLYRKTQQALERMNAHQSMTGIRHDRVMVFPQGIFSERAMSALRRTDLIASVNNDVVSADPNRRAVSLAELWDIAIMDYGFPLFTRRYPWEGIENFAFDALLGKPAIIVIHHDYCSDGCLRLVQFIDRLNSLKFPPAWRNLEEVVRRSYRQRKLSSTQAEIEMYAAELRLENRSEQSRSFSIRRRESESSAIREVRDQSELLNWNSANGQINFELQLNPGQSTVVQIKYHSLERDRRTRDDLIYRFRAMLRRYLCEIRDNYVTTARLRMTNRLGSRD